MTSGILVLDKPRNWTSHDCVAVCRRVLGIKKVGHGGTLDPMAEGVLPVFLGKATRIMNYLDDDIKEYRCTARLGMRTDTQDIWGETLETCDTGNIAYEDIEEALKGFQGEISQIPPKYSAIKLNGRKLYEYAREGIEVEIKPRKVTIHSMVIDDIDMEKMEASFTVRCSKGTYVRTICSDLGEKLGCGAAMSYLKRTSTGVFNLDRAVKADLIKEMDREDIFSHVMGTDEPLVNMRKAVLPPDRAQYFMSGNSIRWVQVKLEEGDTEREDRTLYRVYDEEDGTFLGVGYYSREEHLLKADKIFVTRQ